MGCGTAAKVIVKVGRKKSSWVGKLKNKTKHKKIDIKNELEKNHGKSFETLKEEFNTGKGTE